MDREPAGPVEPGSDLRAVARCSDADRDAVVDRLRIAAGEGRLDLGELEDRLDRVAAARTYADLDAVLADLRHGVALSGEQPLVLRTTMADRRHDGRWRVPSRIVAETGLGDVRIDFVDAVCRHAEVEVTVKATVGDVVLVVPEGWSVRTDEVVTHLGSVKDRVRRSGTSPLLRVRGTCGAGSLVVRGPRTWGRWLGVPR